MAVGGREWRRREAQGATGVEEGTEGGEEKSRTSGGNKQWAGNPGSVVHAAGKLPTIPDNGETGERGW